MGTENILIEYGLTDKEVKIYTGLLQLGQSTATTIAKKTKLNRITCYDNLKSLQEKGLVSSVIKSGVNYFESAKPSTLLAILKERQEKVKSILPELERMHNINVEKPSVEFYEGLDGIKTVLNDIIKEGKETHFIADQDFMKAIPYYFPHFIHDKREKKIFSKVITNNSKEMHAYKKNNPKEYVDVKFINFRLQTTKIFYANKVAFVTYDKDNSVGTIIKNKKIYSTEIRLFKDMWDKL